MTPLRLPAGGIVQNLPMSDPNSSRPPRSSHWLTAGIMAAVAALVSACKSAPEAPSTPAAAPLPVFPGSTLGSAQGQPTPAASLAQTPKAYRQDAAQHLYKLNAPRIWRGKLPPMLYAIGTLQVDIDSQGNVQKLHWMRAPSHAPEVVREVERTVRAAAPYPVPSKLSKVTYTDTWLWDESGKFQLDTLSEGQL